MRIALALSVLALMLIGVTAEPLDVFLPVARFELPATATHTATATSTATGQPTATHTPTSTSTNTPTATSTATQTSTTTPTATQPAGGPCLCHANLYNCSDFATHEQAQACFNYCVSQGAGDIHQLDSDDDGVACELLPLSRMLK